MIARLVEGVARTLPLPCYVGGYRGEPGAVPPSLALVLYGEATYPAIGERIDLIRFRRAQRAAFQLTERVKQWQEQNS